MKQKQPQPRPKHIPQRTCIACRTVNSKRGMIRIVRTPTGSVEIDPTSKRSGRGAYLCQTRECWAVGLQKKALDFALKTTIPSEDRAALQAYMNTLPAAETDSDGTPRPDATVAGAPEAPAMPV